MLALAGTTKRNEPQPRRRGELGTLLLLPEEELGGRASDDVSELSSRLMRSWEEGGIEGVGGGSGSCWPWRAREESMSAHCACLGEDCCSLLCGMTDRPWCWPWRAREESMSALAASIVLALARIAAASYAA